jgi:hypothetical protein
VKFFLALLICALTAPAGFEQAKPKAKQSTAPSGAGEEDRLGLSCAQILQMSSTEWVAHFEEKDASAEGTGRAIAAYGRCYDARTNRLGAMLGKAGKGPLMGARGNFGDFEKAINDFAAMALAATDPPAGEQKKAYAALYEKQFRNEFYKSYAQKSTKSAAPAASTANAGAPAQTGSPTEVSELTKAKNRFGELLGLLPEEKMHELHKAFGRIFSGSPVNDATKIAVYRYAIFLLEPATEKPFSPPPF